MVIYVLSYSVVSDSLWPHGLLPARLLCWWTFPGKNTGVGCHFYTRGSFWPKDQTLISCISCNGRWILYHQHHLAKWKSLSRLQLFATPWTIQSTESPGQNTGVGSLSLLEAIFPTQGLNPGFPHCRQILYQLSHKGSPRILEWVAYPFFLTQKSIRGLLHWGGFFSNWASREALVICGTVAQLH